jgi:hypothetical protein
MLRKIIYASAAAAVFATAGMSPASAAGPSLGLAAKLGAGSLVERASFWGEPYPYGYRYRHGCLRRVWEHTPWGRERHLVWVCRPVH